MAACEGFIVVGVDDSPGAVAALGFALDEAIAHGCAVEVVTAWLWSSPFDGMDEVGTLDEGQHLASGIQDAVLRAVMDVRTARPIVSRAVVHENAGRALVERTEGARMLVVGSARKGTVARAVLGSVSEYCVRHAPAPVVVVADAERLQHRSHGEIEEVVR